MTARNVTPEGRKFCKDCEHCIENTWCSINSDYELDKVSGEKQWCLPPWCSDMRKNSLTFMEWVYRLIGIKVEKCGEDAVFFKQKVGEQ